MKVAIRGLHLLVFVLALGIVGREAPEYASLSDDPSNDGESVAWNLDAVPEITLASLLFGSADIPPVSFFVWSHLNRFATTLGTSPAVAAGPDLLHRLALQRK